MVLRKIIPRALIDENRVVMEGNPEETLPSDRVYVSPTSGRSYSGAQSDKVAQLPPDAVEIERTTWGINLPWKRQKEGEEPSPSVFLKQKQWYETNEGKHQLKSDLLEMQKAGLDFELFVDEKGTMLWEGRVEGVDIEIRYPENYPEQRFQIILPPQFEKEAEKLNSWISKFPKLTPALSVTLVADMVTSKKDESDAMAPKS